MKRFLTIFFAAVFVVNLLIGLIVSSYGAFNVVVTSLIIAATYGFMYYTDKLSIKDGFRVGLYFLFSIVGFIEYLIGIFMPSQFTDNYALIFIILLLAVEFAAILGAHTVSTKIK